MIEGKRHREAFELYFRLGERSIERLRQALIEKNGHAPSMRTLYQWSITFQWQHQLAQWEQKARVADDEARLAAINEMSERQAATGVYLQQKGLEWIEQLHGTPAAVESAIKAIVEGTRLEQLARGEATERQEVKNELSGRFESISDERLDLLIEYAERVVGGEAPAQSK